MVFGAAGAGESVSFGIKAVADLRGIEAVARSLRELSVTGKTVGQGTEQGAREAARALAQIGQHTERAEQALDRLGDEGQAAGRAIDRGMDQASRSIAATEGRADRLATAMGTVSRVSLLGAAAIGAVGVVAVGAFANFDTEMRTAQAVTGATTEEMERLREKALQMGKDTAFSASEAAGAITELGKAGVSVEDILNGGADGAANLAAAAGIGIPRAAEIIANALNVFNLAGEDATRVADLFAAAEVKSAAGADELAQALAQAGQVANQFSIPIDEAIAALALFADEGLRGSDAGTSFRTMLLSTLDPTKEQAAALKQLGLSFFDAQGNFIGLAGVAEQLRTRLAGLSQEQRNTALAVIFGSDAVRAASILYEQGAAGVNEYVTATNDVGAAARIAETRLGGLGGALEELRGSVETAAIEFGENLAPAVIKAADAVSVLADAFAALPEEVQTGTASVLGGLAGILLVTAGVSKSIQFAATNAKVLASVGTGLTSIVTSGAGVAALGSSLVGLGATIAALAAPVGLATFLFLDQKNVVEEATRVTLENKDALEGYISFLEGMDLPHAEVKQMSEEMKALFDAIGKTHFGDFEATIDADLNGPMKAFIVTLGDMRDELLNLDPENMEAVLGLMKDLGIEVNRPETWNGDSIAIVTEFIYLLARAENAAAQEALELNRAQGLATIGLENTAEAADVVNAALTDQIAITDDQIAQTIKSRREQDALKQSVQDTMNAQFLAGAAAEGLFLPFTRDADDARKATEDFNKSLEELQQDALNAARGLEDIAPSLEGMQAGFGKAGDSVIDLFRAMDDLGVINLDVDARGALDAVSALTKVQAKIEDVEAAISNNQGDLAMWSSRISLVTDTFGANSEQIGEWTRQLQEGEITQDQFNFAIGTLAGSGGFPKLDALLAQGKITQEEYGQAVAAGTHLLQRSTGALQDEAAEIVRNVIALDDYVRSHDDADGTVKGLTDKQRGFIAAMSDSKVQTYLQTVQLLFYLATIGQIPATKVTEFIANSGQADPVIAGINDDLGFLDDGTTIPIGADDTEYQTTKTDIEDDEIAPKTVRFTSGRPDGIGFINDGTDSEQAAPATDSTFRQPDPIVVTVNSEQAATARERVKSVTRALGDLAGKTVTLSLGSEPAATARERVKSVTRAMNDLDDIGFRLGIDDQPAIDAKASIDAASRALRDLDGESATVHVYANTSPFWTNIGAIPDSLGTRYIDVVTRQLGGNGTPSAAYAMADTRPQTIMQQSYAASQAGPATSGPITVTANFGDINEASDIPRVQAAILTTLERAADRVYAATVAGG